MAIARSKLTSQGQISVPADVRKKLGIGPGSTLEWDEEGDKIVVRRAGTYTLEDVRRAAFGGKRPKPATIEEMRDSIRKYVRNKYARTRS